MARSGNPHPVTVDLLKNVNTESAEIVAQSKALTHALNNRKYKQEDVYRIIGKIENYIDEQRQHNKPLTIAGFILASGISQSTWYEAKNGDKDNITALYAMAHPQQVDEEGVPFYIDEETGEQMPLVSLSEVVKNCHLLIQAQLEGNCYTNKGNPAGSIFGLKAQFGWSDDTTPQHLTQVVQICDAEQARKALEMLHG